MIDMNTSFARRAIADDDQLTQSREVLCREEEAEARNDFLETVWVPIIAEAPFEAEAGDCFSLRRARREPLWKIVRLVL